MFVCTRADREDRWHCVSCLAFHRERCNAPEETTSVPTINDDAAGGSSDTDASDMLIANSSRPTMLQTAA
jgi:hypothetical protein